MARKESRVYKDRAEYIKRAVTKRRQRIKELIVQYKGGVCEICGYKKCIWALDLHHKNPGTKSFELSGTGYSQAWEKIKREADKCMLVCANCHREIEAEFVTLKNK